MCGCRESQKSRERSWTGSGNALAEVVVYFLLFVNYSHLGFLYYYYYYYGYFTLSALLFSFFEINIKPYGASQSWNDRDSPKQQGAHVTALRPAMIPQSGIHQI